MVEVEKEQKIKIDRLDEKQSKVCSKCKIEKPVTDFGKYKSKYTGIVHYNSYCRTCTNKINRDRYNKVNKSSLKSLFKKHIILYWQSKENSIRLPILEGFRILRKDLLRLILLKFKVKLPLSKLIQLVGYLLGSSMQGLSGAYFLWSFYYFCDLECKTAISYKKFERFTRDLGFIKTKVRNKAHEDIINNPAFPKHCTSRRKIIKLFREKCKDYSIPRKIQKFGEKLLLDNIDSSFCGSLNAALAGLFYDILFLLDLSKSQLQIAGDFLVSEVSVRKYAHFWMAKFKTEMILYIPEFVEKGVEKENGRS